MKNFSAILLTFLVAMSCTAQPSDNFVTKRKGWLIWYAYNGLYFCESNSATPNYDNFFNQDTLVVFSVKHSYEAPPYLKAARQFSVKEMLNTNNVENLTDIFVIPLTISYHLHDDSSYFAIPDDYRVFKYKSKKSVVKVRKSICRDVESFAFISRKDSMRYVKRKNMPLIFPSGCE